MKRLLVVTLVALLGSTALSACGGDDAVVTVNGENILTVDELTDELGQLAGADNALVALDGRGDNPDSLSSAFVATVLDNHVLLQVIEDEVAARDLEVTREDEDAGTQILTAQLAANEAGVPLALEDVPSAYRQVLTDLFANYAALIVDGGGNLDDQSDPVNQTVLADISDTLLQRREEATVKVARRFGRWDADADRPGIVPPEGPVTPTTAPLAVPVG